MYVNRGKNWERKMLPVFYISGILTSSAIYSFRALYSVPPRPLALSLRHHGELKQFTKDLCPGSVSLSSTHNISHSQTYK
jgi:hypothetical protein